MITDKIIHNVKREGNAYVITFKIDSAIVLDKFDNITHTHTEYGTRFEDFIHEMKESGVEVFSTRAYDKYEGDYVLRHFMVLQIIQYITASIEC
jgi:predicted peroxiredoxin